MRILRWVEKHARGGLRRLLRVWLLAFVLCAQVPAFSHPAPFSYLDLHLEPGRLEATLIAHTIDFAYDLGLGRPEDLLVPSVVERERQRIEALVGARLSLNADGRALQAEFKGIEILEARQALRLSLRFPLNDSPGVIQIRCALFPYDPNHQTFVNLYEKDELANQVILEKNQPSIDYFTGSRQGALSAVQKFTAAGIHHIIIGPDHILFIVGLLLLGGGIFRLVKIVTAFTIAHSITLTLAALDLFHPPSRIIEPAIALSIVYVGVDNILVSREGRDVRAWIAFFFGLIHGFGFANVLQELGLPRQALGWSLFSFNLGVEIGQVCIVITVAMLLSTIRSRSELLARRIAIGGSYAVILAGAWWFMQRVFFQA